MTKKEVILRILKGRSGTPGEIGQAFAPTNIALCKYWGKRDEELNLPHTSSLSISLGTLGAHTTVRTASEQDRLTINGEEIPASSPLILRISAYLDLFRQPAAPFFDIETESNIPLAAGLASSASGFAALVLALDKLFAWNLSRRELSILARLGSGSAARSMYHGFVRWNAGKGIDGMDSFAERLDAAWPGLRIGLLMLSTAQKPVPSRDAMKRTVETSTLYGSWPAKVQHDLAALEKAIADHDFQCLGQVAESNALAMHATMMDSMPPILYWLPETVSAIKEIWDARQDGLPVYFTIDAGPNVKVLFEADTEARVKEYWPHIEIAEPFAVENE